MRSLLKPKNGLLVDQIARLNSWETEKLTLEQLRRIKAILDEPRPTRNGDGN